MCKYGEREVGKLEGGKGRKVGKNFPAKNHILSFLAGKFFLPCAEYLVARILFWRPENFYLRNEIFCNVGRTHQECRRAILVPSS